MKDEAFEEWFERRQFATGPGYELSRRRCREAWQAAKDDDRKPQTAETCKAVPPHSMGCLRPAFDLANPAMWKPGCLVCEAVAKARDEASKRILICVWCGQMIERTGNIETDVRTCQAHDQGCEKNPLKDELAQAQAKCAEAIRDRATSITAAILTKARCAAIIRAGDALVFKPESEWTCDRLYAWMDAKTGNPGQALLDELKTVKTALAEAAMEINCSGPVAERIRVLKREWSDRLAKLERVRERKIVCLCGSTRFMDAFFDVGWEETLKGNIVLSVGVCKHADDHGGEALGPEVAAALDELHLRKIDLADEVIILNVEGYVGDSTYKEWKYAVGQGKAIRWLEPDEALAAREDGKGK